MHTRTPSIRTLVALAYERGEEFDPALMLSPSLAEQLDGIVSSRATDFALSLSGARWHGDQEARRS